jgi:hypothetical protein
MEKPKIIGKIDLSQFEKKKPKEKIRTQEQIIEFIDAAMVYSVPLINERAAQFENAPNPIVDSVGKINMDSYINVYGEEVVNFDTKNAHDQKRGFYQTYTKETQEKYGTTNEDEILKKIEKQERMRDGNISEEALFLLMNKIAGDRYMAVRSCDHDDYLNGTDLLLVDTVSGKTICAFDETVEGVNSRLEHKITRAKDTLTKGRGMNVKYGLSFLQNEDGVTEMSLGAVKNIPPLFLALNKDSLNELLQHMDFNIDTEMSDIEKKVMSEMVINIDSQIDTLETIAQEKVSYEAVKDFMNHLKSNLEFVSK